MELSQFLARTVAAGGYLAISANPDPVERKKPWITRLFPAGHTDEAVGYARWADRKGWEVYHAQGAYKTAEIVQKDGRTQFHGSKEQDNVSALRSFWIDLDCKRDGDKKDPSTVFADRTAALSWLKKFVSATGLPLPNQVVDSGYGFHCYWLLEDPILKHQWQPYADAMKAAMLANGFVGDSGLTSDCARVLRPIGMHNRKVLSDPKLVTLIERPQLLRGEIPNAIVLSKLQPYVGQVVQVANGGSRAQTSALAGGTVSPLFGAATQPLPNMAAAASAGVARDTRPRYFQRIAQECVQAKLSLASHGAGDQYPLWYLGFMSLLTFLDDGQSYAHTISDGDPRYVAADVDAAYQRAVNERNSKGLGAPTCQVFERGRPGVCATCPHFGKIVSPVSLGIKDGDLPAGYRRDGGAIEVSVFDKDAKAFVWKEVVTGDVHSPILDKINGGYQLVATYERAGHRYPLAVTSTGMVDDTGKVAAALSRQYLTINRAQTTRVTDFLMAWINKLRDMKAERVEKIYPFGWATSPDEGVIGFAAAGTLYRNHNNMLGRQAAPGGDPQVMLAYEPRGLLTEWQKAANFVIAGRPDLQIIVAAAFGAPLMKFTGQKGVVVSTWSRSSAVGKSSAIEVGRSVWGSSAAKNTLRDTTASVMRKLAETRVMPCYWDEMRVDDDNTTAAVNMIFNISEGKEKSRLNSDASLKPSAEWETITCTASNQSLMDLVVRATAGTDAGALRLFEFEIRQPTSRQDPAASQIVALTNDHYGRAGEIYAAYLGLHHERIADVVRQQYAIVSKELQANTEERFFVAGITTILVGAKIATNQNILKFDMPALKTALYQAFNDLRKFRQGNLLIGPAGMDHEQIFSMFVNEHHHEKLITSRFARQGVGVAALSVPQNMRTVTIHISQGDDAMRVNRAALNDWCRKRGIPGRSLIEALENSWGAIQIRAALGGGTIYSSGAINCVEIPLAAQGAQDYRYADPNAKPVKAGVP